MNYFEVTYLFKGRKRIKILRAQNRMDALSIAKIRLPGIIIKIAETSAPVEDQLKEFQKQFVNTLLKPKIKIDNLISSIRQLGVMTNAGISIHDSVKEVIKTTEDKRLRRIFENIDDALNSGQSLTEALSLYRQDVGDVTIAMVELGENTGNMSESLLKLATILEEIRDNRKKFKSALRYPVIVLIAISIAFTILMVYVVPKFKEIFAKFHTQLPLPTRILLFLENIMHNYGWYLLTFIIASIAIIKFMYVNNEEFKKGFDRYILKVYLFGKIIFNATMYRFTMIFTQLIAAGIPIADALDTAVLTVDNTTIKEKLSNVTISVQRGMSLSNAFRDTGLFTGMLLQMVGAGERSGTLDTMLEKVSDYYKMRFDEIVDNISSYIEPILIGFIAVMVLMMALGIFLPMWDLASAVKHG